MTIVINLTDGVCDSINAMALDGRDAVFAVAYTRFQLPEPGHNPHQNLERDDRGAPATNKEVSAYTAAMRARHLEPITDADEGTSVVLVGTARTPNGELRRELFVGVRVGRCQQVARVFGVRVWEPGLSRVLSSSAAKPFNAIPLNWRRAFGGSVRDEAGELEGWEPRNPTGIGFYVNAASAAYRELPNIEDPRDLIRSHTDRPAPVGFLPVPPGWQPRLSLAGTYDEAWVRGRAPLWPEDVQPRFFMSAPAALQHVPHLRGGEPVQVVGCHPQGDLRFFLPQLPLVCRMRFAGSDVRKRMNLRTVVLDADEGSLTLIHGAWATARPNIAAHRETVIREQKAWELAL